MRNVFLQEKSIVQSVNFYPGLVLTDFGTMRPRWHQHMKYRKISETENDLA